VTTYPAPTRKFYDLRDGRISAVHFGLTSNPVKLVMLHANGFHGYAYKCLLEPLGVHCVALDMRGHGLSELPTDIAALRNWHIFRDDTVEFFNRYIDHPVVLAGHSYGAVAGILSAPLLTERLSGYVGFDPVTLPGLFRQISNMPGGRAMLKKRFFIAAAAGRRKAFFADYEVAFARYKDRGAFRGFTDEALHDYLTGGLIAYEGGVRLACDPKWEQAIFTAQAHNLFKAARFLPKNSHITFAGKYGSVSFQGARKFLARQIGPENITYDTSRAHMFPMHDPAYAAARLSEVLSKAALDG
jgi:pimeloyl-ACP methyl ester carboxylesterase